MPNLVREMEGLLVIFLIIAVVIVIISIKYEIDKEKEFTEEVQQLLTRRFPFLIVQVASEGGIFSYPHIIASNHNTSHPLQFVEIKYVSRGGGEHKDVDLYLHAVIARNPQIPQFSLVITCEGFFKRLFGGKDFELGIREIDDKLYMKTTTPTEVASFFQTDNFYFLRQLALEREFEEAKIDTRGRNETLEFSLRLEIANKASARRAVEFIEMLLRLCGLPSSTKEISERKKEIPLSSMTMSSEKRRSVSVLRAPKIMTEPHGSQDKKIPERDHEQPAATTASMKNNTTAEKIAEPHPTKITELPSEMRSVFSELQLQAKSVQILQSSSATIEFFSGVFPLLHYKWNTNIITATTEGTLSHKTDFHFTLKKTTKHRTENWLIPSKPLLFPLLQMISKMSY